MTSQFFQFTRQEKESLGKDQEQQVQNNNFGEKACHILKEDFNTFTLSINV